MATAEAPGNGTDERVPFVLSASAPAPHYAACRSGRERTLWGKQPVF
ncbi:hypothetical protein [Bacteroides fragilis]|nr:hypothetical protein [Bacteroides fragilis]